MLFDTPKSEWARLFCLSCGSGPVAVWAACYSIVGVNESLRWKLRRRGWTFLPVGCMYGDAHSHLTPTTKASCT